MPDKQSGAVRRRVWREAKCGALAPSSSMLVGEPTEVWPQARKRSERGAKALVGGEARPPPAEGGRARCFRKADLSGPRLPYLGRWGEGRRWRPVRTDGGRERTAGRPRV